MIKVRYEAEFIPSLRSWNIVLCDLDITIQDDERIIALSKAHAEAAVELNVDDSKIELVEVI